MAIFRTDYDFSLIRTSSKEALLRSALLACNNDIKKASEICDYVTKMLPNLPDTDPVVPSSFEQMRDTAVQVFQWGQEHQDQIVGVINVVQQLLGKQPISIPPTITEVPPPPLG